MLSLKTPLPADAQLPVFNEFFFWVIINYSGPFSKGHETSACWRWDDNSHRLVLHEEYNHQT